MSVATTGPFTAEAIDDDSDVVINPDREQSALEWISDLRQQCLAIVGQCANTFRVTFSDYNGSGRSQWEYHFHFERSADTTFQIVEAATFEKLLEKLRSIVQPLGYDPVCLGC